MASFLTNLAAKLSNAARAAVSVVKRLHSDESSSRARGFRQRPTTTTPATSSVPAVRPIPVPPPSAFAPAPADDSAASEAQIARRWRTGQSGRQPLDTGDAAPLRAKPTDPTLTGRMVMVTSSNVHSIGFAIDPNSGFPMGTKGSLFVRFLGGHGKERGGPGPMYEYFDVPVMVFKSFLRAQSKGKFLWDEIRVRGTASGHRYRYDLTDVVNEYVPRQAGLKRGQSGEWYMTRRFRDATGKVLTSRLPEQKVKSSGPNPAKGPGANALTLQRGTPNRGTPNRGTPNRGR